MEYIVLQNKIATRGEWVDSECLFFQMMLRMYLHYSVLLYKYTFVQEKDLPVFRLFFYQGLILSYKPNQLTLFF